MWDVDLRGDGEKMSPITKVHDTFLVPPSRCIPPGTSHANDREWRKRFLDLILISSVNGRGVYGVTREMAWNGLVGGWKSIKSVAQ